MKNFVFFFVVVLIFLFSLQTSAQNVSPHFSELKGMEDNQGNTHLLYRIYSYLYNNGISISNNIYNLVPETSIDTIYFYSSYFCDQNMGWGITVHDYDYWENDLTKFIVSGEYETCMEPSPFISRFDSNNVYNGLFLYVGNIIISNQNDSLVFGLPYLISYNGGFTWDTLNTTHHIVSVSPFNDSILFAMNNSVSQGQLIFKSTDRGENYYIVDTVGTLWYLNTGFYYDTNGDHIYRHDTPSNVFKVSAQQGNPFTWQTIYETSNQLFVCLDESQSGAIYLADGNKIMYSSDYGNTFSLYKELDKKIIGIYKKPNSDKLYAATKYRIYEITNNSIAVLKSLPIPVEALDFYPLQVSNKWIYERIDYSLDWITGTTIIDTSYFQRKVLGLEIKPNGNKYYKIDDYDFYNKLSFENYERIDSSTGLIYRYDATLDSTNFECIIDDLMLEQGNLFNTSRLYSYYYPVGMIFENEDYYNGWSLYRKRNGFSGGSFGAEYYSLTQGIGLDSVFVSLIDAFDAHIDLKGCVIDGIVYGDTTLTDIDGCIEPLLPKHFVLDQNYPNPFNPTTKINWQSPISGHQTLKVYDVLGNEVATLIDEYRNTGIYEVEFEAAKLSSGVYFYQLIAGDFVSTKKLIVLK